MDREPYKRDGRCVHCGEKDVAMGAECRYSKGGHGSMDLPEGRMCGDCLNFRRCSAIFGRIEKDESCDFFPVRAIFREAANAGN